MSMFVLCLAFALVPPSSGDVPEGTQQVKKGKKSPTQLKFEIEPTSVVIYVDKKKKGKAKKGKLVRVKPGDRVIRLVNGKDETEFVLRVEKGNTLLVKYAFEDSREETPPAPEPEPKTPAPDDDNSDIPGEP